MYRKGLFRHVPPGLNVEHSSDGPVYVKRLSHPYFVNN